MTRACLLLSGATPAPIVWRVISLVRSGPKTPTATLSAHLVAVDAGVGKEEAVALDLLRSGRSWRSGLLVGHPFVEAFLSVDNDPQQHIRMLCAAILGAVPKIHARLEGIEPRLIILVGDDVGLPSKLRQPKTVNDIG